MPKDNKPEWTEKQKSAIDIEGKNVLVSAGAGSGKTAVLSERVIRKIEDGCNIDEILILTFTKKAAYEMMMRIRKNLKEEIEKKSNDNHLLEQLSLIDKAYITTFDSFTSGIVKKYHDRLKINKSFNIIDENTIDLVRSRELDKIFDRHYESNDSLFHKLIKDYCLKDDSSLKSNILSIAKSLDLKYDKVDYLNKYISEYYNNKYYDLLKKEYEELIKKIVDNVFGIADSLKLLIDDNDFSNKLDGCLESLLYSHTYDDIRKNSDIKLPSVPRGMGDIPDIKKTKAKLKDILDELKAKVEFSLDELIDDYKETKDYVEIIIKIVLELSNIIDEYKTKYNAYEYVDIEKLAIRLVKKYPDIKEELTNSFKEIMVDEYQDTSDLQEELINDISNNNIYMVGDIKQSIYRFRNANPNIFKDKYEEYAKKIGGEKIDLTENFRSRDEVIKDINTIFDSVMSISFGGADYKKSHRLLFGLKTYLNKKKDKQEYNLSILDYDVAQDIEYDNNEIEAFIIANDIKARINNKEQVYDKDLKELRDIKYSDFVILINKGDSFPLYKKIFEYVGLPLTIERDVDISKEIEVSLIRNILKMIKSVSLGEIDDSFKYSYVSIARSYLYRLDDDTIYRIVKENKYKETEIYKRIENIVLDLNKLDLRNLILRIIDEFNFYEKMLTIGDISLRITILEKITNLASDLSLLDYDYLVFSDYLDEILNNKHKQIKVEISVIDPNSVKLMTIHASKGLEYPICYYAGLKNKFNLRELNESILYNNKYGIVTANYNNGYHNTFIKDLVKDNYINEEISERIRLFYVALTRAREKMVIVADLKEDYELDSVTDSDRNNYRSFLDIINSVKKQLSKYIIDVDLDKIGITRDYKNKNIKELEELNGKKIDVKELSINLEEIDNSKFSKTSNTLVTKEEKDNMLFGNKMHEMFEFTNLKEPNLDVIDEKYRKYIINFLKQDIVKNIKDANIFKEYEFYDEERNGKIDLMLEYNDHIDIIDYKLKHVDDKAYFEQLNGYRNYISKRYNKKVNIYLYSILDDKVKEL